MARVEHLKRVYRDAWHSPLYPRPQDARVRISAKADYAIRAMVELAAAGTGR